ncbi:chemotaxis-specific protein-glutamate methyltransferase CheB [Sphingosinicella sp. LHD-64]|uniref:chemotaxis-specific protein-glutamate methyltransferase CheB n=1 Tax=Sphingosinicella sp. LHD-64 TaxID=3072139 RepID=UPI00280E4E1A|nr:chemotaxis-specific protein-glutamate methyltransferase CheB [Sphingosinicella sp. LHD-64]MDQ8755612.1 chemotaxis-specific protein-glutamate methyltransferase CheB [Sphingosinicella sp. LHD-64]
MIVDDSTVARAVLSRMLASDPDFEVVALAGNSVEAVDALKSVAVDIVLLDVEMPGTSGLEALPLIIRAGGGARVLVVSSMAEDGAEVAVRALAQGAADTLPKPGASSPFNGRFAQVLGDRLRRIGRAGREREVAVAATPHPSRPIHLRDTPDRPLGCVALGASTGGLHALIGFLGALPPRIGAPILVTQHLPAIFMSYFARQLEAACNRKVLVAEDGRRVAPDVVLVAPGDAHLELDRSGGEVRVRLNRRRAPSGCCPSVDPMLAAVAEVYGDTGAGVMLSGMGRDGVIGAGKLVEAGGIMLAQDEFSSAIWGMPRCVAEAGLASAVLPPRELARRIALRAEMA